MNVIYSVTVLATVVVASSSFAFNEAPSPAEPLRPVIIQSYLATQVPAVSAAPVDGLTFAHVASDLAKLDPARPQIWQTSVAPDASAWERK